MDNTTQQNAALVEEMAAAASSLKSQAQELVQVVSVFKLSSDQNAPSSYRLAPQRPPEKQSFATPPAKRVQAATRPAIALKPRKLAAPAASAPAQKAPAQEEDSWETF
jgi:hypothetical protein